MNIDNLWNSIHQEDGLSRTLGMEFISTPEDDTLKARMAVDDRNKQPFGFLSGGASLALAENLAGVGSMALCPGKMALGINVHGNHVKAMPYGGTVTAYGRLIHKGHTLHVWNIDIKNDEGELISSVQVTNYVIAPSRNKWSRSSSTGSRSTGHSTAIHNRKGRYCSIRFQNLTDTKDSSLHLSAVMQSTLSVF